MTIQEAIKSGKPFRRKTWGKKWREDWYRNNPIFRMGSLSGRIYWIGVNYEALTFDGAKELMRDILADDWEIKK